VKSAFAATPTRLAALALTSSLLAGCTTYTDGLFGSRVDYKTAAVKTAALEVPPDLSQLARDSRFQPQGGVISAAAAAAGGPTNSSNAGSGALGVALVSRGDARVERSGQERWLVVAQTPEQIWPQLQAFWTARGFVLEVDDPKIGVMETNWSENRAKLADDVVRNTLGRLLQNLYDSGERDRYRTRVERTGTSSEIFISHRGLSEVYTNERRDTTTWRARASEPQLEAEFLSRFLMTLGAPEAVARATVANAPESPARARLLAGRPAAALEIDEPFDRAWRRVGLALDRSGFSVEDRDRAGGLYYVRYIDPAAAGKDEPNWFMKWFDKGSTQAAVRYRVAVQSASDKTTVSVLTSAGAPENGDNAKRIVALLVTELK